MFVYKAERDAGLADRLRKPAPVALASRAEPSARPAFPAGELAARAPRAVASVGDDDLFWFKSVLVSSGFNDNDHYFDVAELWAARHTPEDKPINVDHVQHQIVGHMVGCYAVAADKTTVVDDDAAPEELPAKIHLIDAGVLYRRWEDPKLQKQNDKIVAEIEGGTRSVSMECWFDSFDYVLEQPDGSHKVVARNKETAKLTKELKFFGGSGLHDGRRLGMLLRGLTFAGKGLVADPANPDSEVVETGGAVERAAAEGYTPSPTGVNHMADDKTAAELADLRAKCEANQRALADADAAQKALQGQLDQALADLKAANDGLKAATDELGGIKAAAAKAARLDAVHEALGLPRTDEGRSKAAKFLEPVLNLSEDMFKALLNNQRELAAAASQRPGLDGAKPDAVPDLAVPAVPEAQLASAFKAVADRYRTKNKKGN